MTKVVREITEKQFKELGSLGVVVKFDFQSDRGERFYDLDHIYSLFEYEGRDSYADFTEFHKQYSGKYKYKFYAVVEVEDG